MDGPESTRWASLHFVQLHVGVGGSRGLRMCRGGPTAQAGLERARWAAVREHRPFCVHQEPRPGLLSLKGRQRLPCSPLTSELTLRTSLFFWGKISHSDNSLKGKGGSQGRLAQASPCQRAPRQRAGRWRWPRVPVPLASPAGTSAELPSGWSESPGGAAGRGSEVPATWAVMDQILGRQIKYRCIHRVDFWFLFSS